MIIIMIFIQKQTNIEIAKPRIYNDIKCSSIIGTSVQLIGTRKKGGLNVYLCMLMWLTTVSSLY